MELYSEEKILNTPLVDIISKINRENLITVYLSGSVIEGFFNSSSDIDVYVITEKLNFDTKFVRVTEHYGININYIESQRVDYEYWPIEVLSEMSKKLSNLSTSDENQNILDGLNEYETEFIHNLYIGKPIINLEFFRELKSKFDISKFRHYLIENQIIYTDDAFDDTVGMYESGEIKSAVLRARYTVESSMDAFLYFHNFTNVKTKHRFMKMDRLIREKPKLKSYYGQFWNFLTKIPDESYQQKLYIADALRFSSKIIEEIQSCGEYYENTV